MVDYHGNLKISDHFIRRYAERVLDLKFATDLEDFDVIAKIIAAGVNVTSLKIDLANMIGPGNGKRYKRFGEFFVLVRDNVAVTLIFAACDARPKKKRNIEGRRRAIENEDERLGARRQAQ